MCRRFFNKAMTFIKSRWENKEWNPSIINYEISFLIELTIKGTYIKNNEHRPHKTSLSIKVSLNFSLSLITKKAKETNAKIKTETNISPIIMFVFLNSMIESSEGTNNNNIKPMPAPIP